LYSTQQTEVTRYFCAAALIDPEFRHYVMEHIVHEEHRAIVVPYGVDLVSVVRYCLAAEKTELARDWILLGLLIIAGSLSLYVLHFPFIPVFLIPLLLLLVAWVVVAYDMWSRCYGKVAAGLAKGKFDPNNLHLSLNSQLKSKLEDLSNTQGNNAIIYSGYSPFVGAGEDIGAWSFTVDVSKGKQGKASLTTFQLNELYHYVTCALSDLHIQNLCIEDKLFVNGQEIRDKSFILGNPYKRPCLKVDPYIVWNISENPSQNIRHYKCIRVTSWSGELILSIFLRFSRVGKNLFVEANYLLLPPLRRVYHFIDSVEVSFSLKKVLHIGGTSFLSAIPFCLFSPAKLLNRGLSVLDRIVKRRRIDREIHENPAFDYGAVSSLREVASSQFYWQHFQKLDKEMYVKVIESQILESIIKFLDTKSIDTTELKGRQEVILNNGVIVSDGGSFNATNLAVGRQASALMRSEVANLAK
jgi:hypothetical protein